MSIFSFPHLDMLEKVLEKIKNPATQLLELFKKNWIFQKSLVHKIASINNVEVPQKQN